MEIDKLYVTGALVAVLATIVIFVTTMKEYKLNAVQFRIARPTSNLESVIKFYQKGLGLQIIGSFKDHDGYDGVMFGLPDDAHHLEFVQRTNQGSLPPPTKENLLVFYFENLEIFEAANQRLQEVMNIKPVEPENPYWKGKSVTYEDPDNWRVVLFNGPYRP